MPDTTDDRLDRLRKLSRTLRRRHERAEARIPSLNAAILDLCSFQILPQTVLLGPVIYDRPYHASDETSDSYQVLQAALLITGGLGVVVWDSEDHAAYRRAPSAKTHRVFEAFVPYERCGPGSKALLLPEVDDLLDRLFELATPRRTNESGEPMRRDQA